MFYLSQYYFEYYLFMLPAIIFVLWAQIMVKSRYKKYGGIRTQLRVTGSEAAKDILTQNGVGYIPVTTVSGELTDHFNPGDGKIYLSDGVYSSTSIAAVGIAAHEAGHAIQHEQHYAPAAFRRVIVPVCNIGAQLSLPICIIGAIFSIPFLVNIGLILFSLMVLFQLVTLPVEFNASRRALAYIKTSSLYTPEEYKGAKKVLTAAAMTYVAALAQALLQLLFFILRFSRRRD